MTSLKEARLDQSVTVPGQDSYGFRHVATQLAESVQAIGRESSAVKLALKVHVVRGKLVC